MKNLLSALVLSGILLCSISGYAAALPDAAMRALEDAHQTGNPFVIEAVTKAIAAQYPEIAVPAYTEETTPAPTTPSTSAPEAVEQFTWRDAVSGSVEAGATFNTGNSEEEQINAAAEVTFERGKWENITELSLDTTKANDIRTEEEYRANNQTRYNFSEKDYGFFELDYVKDRFSGFDHRLSESLGYGRHLIKKDNMNLSAEASVGARQTQFTDGEDAESLLGTLSADYDWKFSDDLAFEQRLSASFASDTNIYRSYSAVRSDLTETLFLKLSFDVENFSNVPTDRDSTDTETRLVLGYAF